MIALIVFELQFQWFMLMGRDCNPGSDPSEELSQQPLNVPVQYSGVTEISPYYTRPNAIPVIYRPKRKHDPDFLSR
jgi:hypothetical protein